MTGWLGTFFALCATSIALAGGDASRCQDKNLSERFLEAVSSDFDYSVGGVQDAFRPFMPGLKTCLTRWVEDGGV